MTGLGRPSVRPSRGGNTAPGRHLRSQFSAVTAAATCPTDCVSAEQTAGPAGGRRFGRSVGRAVSGDEATHRSRPSAGSPVHDVVDDGPPSHGDVFNRIVRPARRCPAFTFSTRQHRRRHRPRLCDTALFVPKRDVKLQPTNHADRVLVPVVLCSRRTVHRRRMHICRTGFLFDERRQTTNWSTV